ncbi:hypothetical protein [Ruegeria arenilitoris]|uniref:hypothetical protein n=1 Tax=Ruegeria arenilitoris TaxID=1173585 RepID=UPI00158148E1|nr:hypothetical protein [Ruegeria arenilitoris]
MAVRTLLLTQNKKARARRLLRARHILDHYYTGPARDDRVLEIWGYTDRYTYRPGDTVELHFSTTVRTWSLEVGRDGTDYVPVLRDFATYGCSAPP